MAEIYILDPSLEGETSHHYYAASALIHEAKTLGLGVRVVSHAQATNAVRTLPARPHFHISGYYHKPGNRRALEVETTACCNAAILKDLMGLNRNAFRRDDFLFFPAITANMVQAVTQWIGSFHPSLSPRFGMCLMFQQNWNPSGRPSDVGETFYRHAFSFIPEELRDRVVYTCETSGLADDYAPLVGKAPIVNPIPTLQHLIDPARRDADPDAPLLSFLGYAKPEKGFPLLPELVRQVTAKRPHARFLIQLMGHDAGLIDGVRRELTELAQGHDIELVEGSIKPPQMLEIMERTALAILPYDNRTYHTRGSAIFTEGKSVGVPMVLPAQTAIGDEGANKGLALTFPQWTAASVSDTIVRALDGFAPLDAAARREAEAHKRDYAGYLGPLLESFERPQRAAKGSEGRAA